MLKNALKIDTIFKKILMSPSRRLEVLHHWFTCHIKMNFSKYFDLPWTLFCSHLWGFHTIITIIEILNSKKTKKNYVYVIIFPIFEI